MHMRMTSTPGAPRKSSKQPVKCVQVVMAGLVFLVVGELFLEKHSAVNPATVLTICPQDPLAKLPRGDPAGATPILLDSPTLHDAIRPGDVVHWDNLTNLAPPKGLRTFIDTSDPEEVRFMRYGMSPVKNVCLRPSGQIVVLGVSEPEFYRSLTEAGETMAKTWTDTYTCEFGCQGAAFEAEAPENALWVTVTTTHIIPYLANIIHHFGERVWPLVTGYDMQPRGEGTPQITEYYYLHRMHTWLDQAHHNVERNSFMFQTALLTRMAPPWRKIKFLQHADGEARPLCFQTLMLSSASCGRMNPVLGLETFAPAMARYRRAAFELFGVPTPQVSLPPRPLRVTLYGRRDASRRRITNTDQVAQYLRTSLQPVVPLVITIVDDLLEQGLYNQSLAQVVSLMTQTDVYITAHGASTWETLFMPEQSAVLEVHGPCGPGTWLSNTIVPGLRLKFRNDRMWGERVAEPRSGNTTECVSHRETPNYTIDVDRLRVQIETLRLVDGPGDRLPLYWWFNWSRNSY